MTNYILLSAENSILCSKFCVITNYHKILKCMTTRVHTLHCMMTIFNSEVYYVHIHKGNFRVVALYQLPFSACYTFLSFHSFFELTSPPFHGPTEHFVFMLYHQTIYLHMNRPYSIIKAIFIQIFSRPSPSVHKSESINFQGDFHTIAFEAYALFRVHKVYPSKTSWKVPLSLCFPA